MNVRLYVIPGSHPSMSARLMLERKGIPYKRVDLLPVVAKGVVRAARFPRATVPAATLDGRRVQGTRQIAEALDELRPEPPLFPSEPDARRAVEAAERWGDETLQPVSRRLSWWALQRDRAALESFSQGARLGLPIGLAVKTSPPIVWAAARLNGASDEAVRSDLGALPGLLDRVDALVEEGVLDGANLNAADFQIGTSLRLLMCFDDLRRGLESRAAGRLAMRIAPSFPGRIRSVFPATWMPAELVATRAAG